MLKFHNKRQKSHLKRKSLYVISKYQIMSISFHNYFFDMDRSRLQFETTLLVESRVDQIFR